MEDTDYLWYLTFPITLIMTISGVIGVFACLFGCKTKDIKDDLVGIEGHVTIRNPEVPDSQEIDGVDGNVTKRSLPDLPVEDVPVPPIWVPTGDASSELYATVGVQKTVKSNPSESESISPQDHPYDRLKKVEHPYAQLKSSDPCSSTANQFSTTDTELPIPESPEPIQIEQTHDIQAAPAIAGHVSATDDLPYITPPTHFSGDSQDSGQGYTSISVREPLSSLTRIENKVRRERQYATVSDDSDDMYAAIGDQTSGSETYAQIQPAYTLPTNPNSAPIREGNVIIPIANVPVNSIISAASIPQAPIPPSVDSLKQMSVVTQPSNHSRQASSSSAASSSVVGSPKPEKRPANSPLPAPPLETNADKVNSSNDLYSRLSYQESPKKNLDDMYAKVNKKRKSTTNDHIQRGASEESALSSSSESMTCVLSRLPNSHQNPLSPDTSSSTSPSMTHSRCSQACHGHSTTPHSTTESTESSSSDQPRNHTRLQHDDDVNSSSSNEIRDEDDIIDTEGGYERVKVPNTIGYETLSDPAYETLQRVSKSERPCYETLNRPQKIDPGYETLRKGPPSDLDPNYERITDHDYASLRQGNAMYNGTLDLDGYSSIRKPINDIYAIVQKKGSTAGKLTEKSTDITGVEPTYESLKLENDISEPNYESVLFTNNNEHVDPPYQLLAECGSGQHK